jgi:3-hydroxyacyl-CoA dehydrogenase/enoyl-CoA hydratase/3-hydroxybutyryl-CoA epimerase
MNRQGADAETAVKRIELALVTGARGLLEPASFEALDAALTDLERDPRAVAGVLVSASSVSFCEGFDARFLLAAETREDLDAIFRAADALTARLARPGKPIVAAIRGRAAGAGLELALACRARVAASDAATTLALPETHVGLLPWMRGLQHLVATAGLHHALEIAAGGRALGPHEARALGLVAAVVDPDAVVDEAVKLATALAAKPRARPAEPRARAGAVARAIALASARRRHDPHARRLAVDRTLAVASTFAKRGMPASVEVARQAFAELAVSTPTRALIDLERAEEDLLRRTQEARDAHAPPRRCLVVGASAAGVRAADAIAAAGVTVEIVDAVPDGGLAGVDFLVDATADARALGRIDGRAPDRGVVVAKLLGAGTLATTRSGSAFDGVVGLRSIGRVLEIVALPGAAERAVAWASLAAPVDRGLALACDDLNGGFCERIRAAYVNEALFLLDDGATEAEVVDATTDWGFTADPFTTLLEAGGRTFAARSLAVLGTSRAPRLEAVASGSLRTTPAPRAVRPARRGRVAPEEIQARIAIAIVNEAQRCLAAGAPRIARDGDVAAVAALGFPGFRGGPFQYAASLGDELERRRALYEAKLGPRFRRSTVAR